MDLTSIKFKEAYHKGVFSDSEVFSVFYHNIFDYPLEFNDLIKWKSAPNQEGNYKSAKVVNKNGFYFLQGREGLIYKRALRKRTSVKKMQTAKKSSRVLSLIPWIKVVAVTGSLAMNNSDAKSDIDLLLIVRENTLWLCRFLSYIFLFLAGIKTRKSGKKVPENGLCLNMWFDESDLVWKTKRNIYTAHEIAQIIPLINKDKTFEKFLFKNSWILKYWPNSVKIPKNNSKNTKNTNWTLSSLNNVFYTLQYVYMRPKITREIVTKKRAIFHPHDWSSVVLDRINPSSIK